MKRTLAGLLLFSTLFSCHKESSVFGSIANCQVANPLLDLPWLKRIINEQSVPYLQIEQGQYQQKTVYIVSTCGLCFAGGIATVYQCDGTEICHTGTYILEPNPSCRQLNEAITDRKVLLSR
ncbi:DUF6970 domain-containing protein [Spirosoma migulaei]